MFEPVSEQAIAHLQAELVIPMITEYMLNGTEPLDDVAEFTIHDMVGEMHPDTALLCLALSAGHIAAHNAYLPIAKILGTESMRIIDDYAPLWLCHANGEKADDLLIKTQLDYLPEDLECLGDLLDATLTHIRDKSSVTALLCHIFSIEAQAHKDWAEQDLKELDMRFLQLENGPHIENDTLLKNDTLGRPQGGFEKIRHKTASAGAGDCGDMPAQSGADNVVAFPGCRI